MTLAVVIGVMLGATGKAPAGTFLAWLVSLAARDGTKPGPARPRTKQRRKAKPARRRKHS